MYLPTTICNSNYIIDKYLSNNVNIYDIRMINIFYGILGFGIGFILGWWLAIFSNK